MFWFLVLILPYIITIILFYRSLTGIKTSNSICQQKITVSVVVACHDEERNLPALIQSLNSQIYPEELIEIIIIDDNSTDNTFSTALEISSPFRKLVLHNEKRGKKAALRQGINEARGELIISTDADCVAGPWWILTIASFYSDTKAGMIICPVALTGGKGFAGSFAELEFLSLQGITAAAANLGNPVMCNGANLAFSKEAYLRHSDKLRDDLPTGDDIFLLHSMKNDPTIDIMWLESADALVTTPLPSSLNTFLRQRKRWISKWPAYTDIATIYLGIVTFLTILAQIGLAAASIFDIRYLFLLLSATIIKGIADYLLLQNTTGRYNRKELMKWFIPSQLIYPLYVITVAFPFPFRKQKSS